MAVLFATTVPLVALVELLTTTYGGADDFLARLVGPLVLMTWAVIVARSDEPNAAPLVLGAMAYTGAMTILESFFGIELTSFDFATSFGLMMLYAVLAGTLAMGRRLAWAGGLAVFVAAWVITTGLFDGDPVNSIGIRVLVAIAGVVFTTGLVAELYDQLTAAIAVYDSSRRLQNAVARCSEALLVHSDAFALHEAVRAIFEATDSDYAYIDRTVEVEGGPGWEIVASASRGIEESAHGWQTGRYEAIPTAYDALLEGKAAVVDVTSLTGRERDLYAEDDIVSEICVPIFVDGVFRGSIGFVEYSEERKWSEDEVQTLWRAADMVGAYWRRHDDAEALRTSNESKDRLLASVSHEIRTPLTAIVGLSEEIVANRDGMTPGELDELSGIIAVQSRELAELVEDLLVASRADFGNLSIRPEPVELGEQVERVLEGLRESNPTNKRITCTGDPVRAWADPLRVRQIMRNLVTNAIKYGGDQVVVAVRRDAGDMVKVVVSDNGPGVPDPETGLIFERYYRSAQFPTQPGSVGIGLAVSRQLAEMMEGTLDYVPGADGNHRFELTLPVATSNSEALVPEPA